MYLFPRNHKFADIKTRPFAIFGISALLLSLLWAPLIQNALRFESQNVAVVADQAFVTRSVKYNAQGALFSGFHHLDPMLKLNMHGAIASSFNPDVNKPTYTCSTGNCTWDPITTFAYHPSCVDISQHLTTSCAISTEKGSNIPRHCNTTLSGRDYVHIEYRPELISTVMRIYPIDPAQAFIYNTTKVPMWQVVRHISPTFDQPLTASNYTATECSLTPAVLSLRPKVTLGVYEEELLDIWMEEQKVDWYDYQLSPPWGHDKGIYNSNETFGLSEAVAMDWGVVSRFPNLTTNGTVTMGPNGNRILFDNDLLMYINYSNYSAPSCGSPNRDSFACALQDVASAITKTMRNSVFLVNGSAAAIESGSFAAGTTFQSMIFFRIEWYWLVIPGAVWILALATWLLAFLQTGATNVPLWKADPIPLLFLLRGQKQKGDCSASGPWLLDSKLTSYQALAKNMKVRLCRDQSGRWKLEKEPDWI